MTPICCGQDAKWIMQSISLQYWFCKECKNEVVEAKPMTIDNLIVAPTDITKRLGFIQFVPPAKSSNTGFMRAGDTIDYYAACGISFASPPTPADTLSCPPGGHIFGSADICTACGISWVDYCMAIGRVP